MLNLETKSKKNVQRVREIIPVIEPVSEVGYLQSVVERINFVEWVSFDLGMEE